MSELSAYEVGQQYPDFKMQSDGAYLSVSDLGLELLICYANPSTKEIETFRSGETKFALYEEQGILFFLSKFGRQNWYDSSYHIKRATSRPALSEVEEGQGYSLHVFFANRLTGELKVARLIVLPTRLSRKIKEIVDNQEPIANYDNLLDRIMSRRSTQDMVQYAIRV